MRAALALASIAALLAVLASSSCRSPGTRPTDMSAAEHEAKADEERAKAAQMERKYDPEDTATMVVDGGGFGDTATAGSMGIVDYNPTERYRVAAKQHERIAAQHEKAAAKLDAFEDEACRGFSPAVRESCPLLGPVRSVVDVVGGARVELADPSEANAIAAHIRCHVAFANKNGVDESSEMDECPLYLKGLSVDVTKSGELLFKVKSADELARLRSLLREHVTR